MNKLESLNRRDNVRYGLKKTIIKSIEEFDIAKHDVDYLELHTDDITFVLAEIICQINENRFKDKKIVNKNKLVQPSEGNNV